jgi:uncharacterized membrane protein
MFLNFKFSIFDSYQTSLRVNYKNILFYLSWYVITSLVFLVLVFGFGIYTDILNGSVLTQNFAWILSVVKHQLVSFFVGIKYSKATFTGFSFYELLKTFISEDVLNQGLKTISFSEYFNVVLLPKKIVLVPLFMMYLSFVMAASIGYIKTALKFQSGKKATLHDIYQYIYLLPQYLLCKIIMFLICFGLLTFPCLLGVWAWYSKTPGQNTQLDKFSFVLLTVALLMAVLALFIYQRLRFMKYFIIDKEVSAFHAVQLSWNLTQGSVISLLLFSLVAVLVGYAHPMSGLFLMLSLWLNRQAEVSLYRQMIESDIK